MRVQLNEILIIPYRSLSLLSFWIIDLKSAVLRNGIGDTLPAVTIKLHPYQDKLALIMLKIIQSLASPRVGGISDDLRC